MTTTAVVRELARSLPTEELRRMHRYWQAANYVTVGQIHLQDNLQLRWPLTPAHIGFRERGTTATPVDMVSMNGMSRFHLAALALRHASVPPWRTADLIAECHRQIDAALQHAREQFEDPPEIRDWIWTEP
jgi:phosphoketolase